MRRHDFATFKELSHNAPVFDVRTPAEFENGSIPGAINLPLFTNEERAVVGTRYKEEGRHVAIREGLDIVGPKMREIVEFVEEHAGHPDNGNPVFVHCWRGGMRSGSVAWLLEMYGWEVHTLEGGYKAFRRWALDRVSQSVELIVIGGRTGGGKTEILHELARLGEPVIDLEGIGNHRGSAFGALGLGDQPSQQDFDNRLAWRLDELGDNGPIWIEDESRMVGRCCIPKGFFSQMRASPVIVVDVPRARRVDHLVEVYGDAEVEVLQQRFEKISKRLGLERTKLAHQALGRGDIGDAANIALDYYDKAYDYGLSKRDEDTLHRLDNEPDYSAAGLAHAVLAMKDEVRRP